MGMIATTTKSRKAKARALQNLIASDICMAFPSLGLADVHPAIMGQSGIDVHLSTRARDLFPFAIECKNQESIRIWQAIKQSEVNAEKEQLTPLLVIKRNRTAPYVVLRWDPFLHLLTPRGAK
jgi:hypothetical protein